MKDKEDDKKVEATGEERGEPPFENYIEFMRHLQSKPFELLEKERSDTMNGLN